jgi:hypothetical protein
MTRLRDDGELDYDDEKPKNEAFEIERLKAETALEIERRRSRNQTLVAIISLIGVVFTAVVALLPTNSPGEPYKPVIVAVAIAIAANNTEPTPVAIASTATPNAVNTTVATQPPIILVTNSPSDGISQCALQGMINATSSVADLIVSLDNYYGIQAIAGGDWSSPGFVISGPAVFWTDLFENGNNLPSNVSRIRTQGNWGAFLLQSGGNFTIASPNGGGRYLRLISCGPDELQDTPEPVVPTTVVSTPITSTNEVTSDELDAIFGAGNWFCFPHTSVEAAYRNSSGEITVSSPLQYIDFWGIQYTDGQTVPGPGGATVKLLYPLPRTECPESQQAALAQWVSDSRPVTRELIDNQLGSDNWTCTGSTSIDITGRVDSLTVQYPFNSLDMNYLKYGVGDTVSNISSGKLWGFFGSVCN